MALWWNILAIATGNAVAAEPPTEPLTRAYYDLEVASYCGLTTERVQAGFVRESERLIKQNDIDQSGIEAARMQAWKEAYSEWDNRGLGGFRKWCSTDGQAAADRFETIAQ
ncbi:MAG: hypothetical protein OEQ39_03375 [Gammaproteobacteria bacterium]|nr:hypothetical protein [Gammaproteobacteria bacterium]MDH3469055.1 hypothetical protein [Gammaproteobacteria bacterium]